MAIENGTRFGGFDIVASAHHCIIMRTTLTLDDDVAQAAKALVDATGKTLGKIVSELVRRSLRSESALRRDKGIPTFQVARDAEIIPGDRAVKLLAEERG